MTVHDPPTEHLPEVVDAVGGFLFLLEPATEGDYRCLWISGGVRRLLGYEPAAAMAPGWFAAGIHPDDRRRVARETPFSSDEDRVAHELRFRHRDGSYRWFRQELRLTDDGKIAGIAMDVTRRVEAEQAVRERESLHRGLVQTAPEAVVTADTDGIIQEVNPAAEAIFGHPREEMVGRSFLMLFPEDRQERAVAYLRSLGALEAPGPMPSRSMVGRRRSGATFPAEVSVFTHSVGGRRHVTGIVRDVSEREALVKERERVIRELQEALTEVHSLREILPICAVCKDVRDDQGYWHRVESYFRSHASVEFSHGICPQCSARLYGEAGDGEPTPG